MAAKVDSMTENSVLIAVATTRSRFVLRPFARVIGVAAHRSGIGRYALYTAFLRQGFPSRRPFLGAG